MSFKKSERNKQFRNWSGNQVFTPAFTVRPDSEQEIVEAVRHAVSSGTPVRVAGTGHSFTPVVHTGGLLVDLAGCQGITGFDSTRKRVRALAGTKLKNLGDAMWERGLALANMGDIDEQALAGATSTGTHGSGIEYGSLSSTVTWVRILTGTGEIVEFGEEDLYRLRAARTSIGMLGVILELEVQAVPAYGLKESITYDTTDELLQGWDSNVHEARHFSFLWCPAIESAGLYDLPVPAGLDMSGRAYTKRYWNIPDFDDEMVDSTEGKRVDRSYRIYPSSWPAQWDELEYFVSTKKAKDAFIALMDLMRIDFPEQKCPIETRWIKGDDSYMSPFYGDDKVSFSVCGLSQDNYWPYLNAVDELLASFGATAHWGKMHMMTRDRVAGLYPEFEKFLEVRREFDPQGIFLNDHLRPIFG